MEYAYKLTTNGRACMAACMAMEKPLQLNRVAFGSGKIGENINLADVHQLVCYVSDGAVSERRHEGDHFFLTVQYANSEHPEVTKMFYLSEFIVYALDPETGRETDLLYGALGDYCQPVPAHSDVYPPSVFNFPMVLILSDEVDVECSAPAGLVTYIQLADALARHNADPAAHGNGRHVIAARERASGLPDYGLPETAGPLALDLEPYTGNAEVSAVVSGREYDARNMRVGGENAPNGTLILERSEVED